MPKIDLCFSGWLRGVNVETATDHEGNTVDVSKMDSDELCNKLSNGELLVSLSDCMDNASDEEIEIFDFEEA